MSRAMTTASSLRMFLCCNTDSHLKCFQVSVHLNGCGQVAFSQADGDAQPAVRCMAASTMPAAVILVTDGIGTG